MFNFINTHTTILAQIAGYLTTITIAILGGWYILARHYDKLDDYQNGLKRKIS